MANAEKNQVIGGLAQRLWLPSDDNRKQGIDVSGLTPGTVCRYTVQQNGSVFESEAIAGLGDASRHDARSSPTFATWVRHTEQASNASVPSISLPGGSTADGLPVALLLDSAADADLQLLHIARLVSSLRAELDH